MNVHSIRDFARPQLHARPGMSRTCAQKKSPNASRRAPKSIESNGLFLDAAPANDSETT